MEKCPVGYESSGGERKDEVSVGALVVFLSH